MPRATQVHAPERTDDDVAERGQQARKQQHAERQRRPEADHPLADGLADPNGCDQFQSGGGVTGCDPDDRRTNEPIS